MRILHASNFGGRHNGRLFWNHSFKISNGLIRNGHNVYNFCDRESSRSNLLNKFTNNSYVQQSFIETVNNYKPDLIILGHADRINIETLNEIKFNNNSIKIIEWNVDNYYLDNTEKKLKHRSKCLDALFITTADEKISTCLNNNQISFFPNIVDSSIEKFKIFNNSNFKNDVFFALSHGVGTGILRTKNTNDEKSNPRVQLLNYLIKENKNQVNFSFFGLNNYQPIWASDFEIEINKSYSGLIVQREPQLKYCLSDRISQYAGNGLMVHINRNTYYDEILKDRSEAVFYDDKEQLLSNILYYKDNINEARTIAKNCHNKLHLYFNERVVTQYFLDCLNNNSNDQLSSNYNWPIHLYK